MRRTAGLTNAWQNIEEFESLCLFKLNRLEALLDFSEFINVKTGILKS